MCRSILLVTSKTGIGIESHVFDGLSPAFDVREARRIELQRGGRTALGDKQRTHRRIGNTGMIRTKFMTEFVTQHRFNRKQSVHGWIGPKRRVEPNHNQALREPGTGSQSFFFDSAIGTNKRRIGEKYRKRIRLANDRS